MEQPRSIILANLLGKFISNETVIQMLNDLGSVPELYKCRALESELKKHYSQPTITLSDFLQYDLSDENCEGCNITQKAIDNYNDSQIKMFVDRFNSYGVLNSRHLTLNGGDEDEDLTIDKIRLVKNIEEILG